MPHKTVNPEVIRSYKDAIASFDVMIAEAKTFGRKGKNCIDSALKVMEGEVFKAAQKKDNFLKIGTDEGANKARYWQGKEQGWLDAFNLFDKPDLMVEIYQKEKEEYQTELKKVEAYEHRPE